MGSDKMLCCAVRCSATAQHASLQRIFHIDAAAALTVSTCICCYRNEPGKRKHPEFGSLPVCRKCFDLLGAAAWHLDEDWKDEAGQDKYCRFCAGSAPGGTSTLEHCSEEDCVKGFCTGYVTQLTMCEGAHVQDKHCQFCAEPAPGGTSILEHCEAANGARGF